MVFSPYPFIIFRTIVNLFLTTASSILQKKLLNYK